MAQRFEKLCRSAKKFLFTAGKRLAVPGLFFPILAIGIPIPAYSSPGVGIQELPVLPGKGDKEKVKRSLEKLTERFGYSPSSRCAVVVVSSQRLYLLEGRRVRNVYAVSTSKYGTGNRAGSNRTPLGTHRVEDKFGEGARIGTVFRARTDTGRVAEIYTDKTDRNEDLVTTRILHLSGMEEGKNRGTGIDSYQRMIYIHGTPEEGLIGTPASHGCIRMRNREVVEVFEFLPEGSLVEIVR